MTNEPGNFVIERSTTIAAPARVVHGYLDDLRQWPLWSPWEGNDPDLKRTYSGATSGVGASYQWSGNRKAGAGSMTITESDANLVGLDLVFTKPFKARNRTSFLLEEQGSTTAVTWRMTGTRGAVARLMAKIVPMDKFVGKDFEKGLASLKAQAELPDS
ncbi:MAG: SRPBCC family protein [Rhodococcus sp. (in: high G+C Gram-positive bacteria)]